MKQVNPIAQSNVANEWYVNLFPANRLKYYLVTHAETLFSVMFRGVGIRSQEDFVYRMMEEMRNQLVEESSTANTLWAPQSKENIITTAANRRILGLDSPKDRVQKYL